MYIYIYYNILYNEHIQHLQPIPFVVQMGKLRHGRARLANTYTGRKWWIRGLNLCLLIPVYALNQPPAAMEPTYK